MKFVIVEDEIVIREGIRRLLPKLDAENVIVGEAENGAEGYELICREDPDVIITDIRMPVMDGLAMLEKLYAQNCRAKAIILSAYSEFEYARSAIHLGVNEYILKPLSMTDFSEAIDRVKKAIEKENGNKRSFIGDAKQLLKNSISGEQELTEEVAVCIENEFGILPNKPLAVLVSYFETWDRRSCDDFIRKIKMIMAEKPEISYCIIEDEKTKEMKVLIYGYKDGRAIKRWIQGYFLGRNKCEDGVAVGWVEAENLYGLRDSYEHLEQYLEWNILLGDKILISYPEILNVQTAVCVYPLDIENQMKVAVCTNDYDKIEKSVQQFHGYFQNRKVYEPKKIKECYVRFFWMVINLSKEMGNLNFEDLEQRVLLEKIGHTKTLLGLKTVIEELVGRLQKQEGEIENLNVKRTVAMIHEFYRTGITLDEIALKMGITPEYLGTQFHKEMGVNFSAYVKMLRINKAKELLLGTQLKLYEIAEMVGYSDAKYFSRVFKAETGQLPADYRRKRK